jgi:methionyl aminopeptidase
MTNLPATRARLTPGTVSPRRSVPASIRRPHYVDGGRPWDHDDPMVKDADTIAAMRVAGRIAAQATVQVGAHVRAGVTTDELDAIGHAFLIEHGAYPSTLGYKGFPKSLCTSLNESICHGIPDSTVVEDGDLVKVDITAFIGGVHGDTCATFGAGHVSEEARLLSERTHEAMMRGIRAIRPGRPISVIGRVIESYARRYGYGVVRDFTGHGVGPSFHTKPTVLHYDDPEVTTPLEPGMTFTIEPMITLGGISWRIWDDGWTIVTRDGSWVAQWEHSVVVTEDGVEILTLP